jgi:protein SCO1/2
MPLTANRPGTATLRAALACLLLAGWAAAALARLSDAESTVDPAVMQIDELRYLGATVPRDLAFLDAHGTPFTLADVLGKPVILLLSYYRCDGTCPSINVALRELLEKVSRFRLGRDYSVLTVSFDGQDTPGSAAEFLRKAGVPGVWGAGWRFAVPQDAARDTERLAASVGFRYFWSRQDKMFMHPNVLVFLTPEGRIARYVYGSRLDAATVELALVDADWGRIAASADVIDMLAGICFSYNYAQGRYQPNYSLLAGVASLLFGVALVALGALAFRRKMGRMSHGH